MVKSLGICVGATSIKVAVLQWKGNSYRIIKKEIISHEGNPEAVFKKVIKRYDAKDYDFAALTGRKFKDSVNIATLTEPEATENALFFMDKGYNAIISLGSENFILYELSKTGNIIKVKTGNKCASGTGEFFLQQIGRMDVDAGKAIKLAHGEEPYRVSGRCSVFCKSDCTHALNKGIPIGRVCAGLGNMLVDKILELMQQLPKKDIIVVGGVTRNTYVMEQLKNKIDGLAIPEHADVFEAVGSAIYAYKNSKKSVPIKFSKKSSTFSSLPPISSAKDKVRFSKSLHAKAKDRDECILGLDVGSTTTKAVLLRIKDDKVLVSVYLRTNGNPIKASRECYKSIIKQLKKIKVNVTALGVTGSGRHIAGLHAMTDGVINEIIAHATGAAYYDGDVDTILEIGGQDAKYTYLVNGVPCDYAMNEACSAGTGSFLEEAAKESLNIHYLDIEKIALKAKAPPNFNDQCSAFISSDIKNASHENISTKDIVAGLVYSICMNYINRVKGERKVGDRIFMQGGVCYNKAVPLAMANLLGKEIIVPPDPGLMGAFGVALEVKDRIALGLMKKSSFDLDELSRREVEYGKSFVCTGNPEDCDRGCVINIIKLNGKSYPFGGICNKYYNLIHSQSIDPKPFNVVERREEMLFGDIEDITGRKAKTIGIPRSFYAHTLIQLYYHFFKELGFNIVISDEVDPEGVKAVQSSFCYPVEIGHGMYANLLKKKPDYIFLPQIKELFVQKPKKCDKYYKQEDTQSTCITAQSEPYYIRSAFKDTGIRVLTPVLNFAKGWDQGIGPMVHIAKKLGMPESKSRDAYKNALKKQEAFFSKRKEIGRDILRKVEADHSASAIILFGRPYNSFAGEANMGIPQKFASRGYHIIPFDFLPFDDMEVPPKMHWALGQDILRAAKFVKEHPQLFGAYVTNFSCGPDSFIIGFFRDIMKTKPSLTLELDSHSADAGITTRVEAFLDIIESYRKLDIKDPKKTGFKKAEVRLQDNSLTFISSDAKEYPLTHKKIKILFPSMGRHGAEIAAAIFRGFGYNSEAVPLPDFSTLMRGRANASCKECLPLLLVTGSLLEYIEKQKKPDEMIVYFMPTAAGGCRFGQYNVFLDNLISKKEIKDVALLTLTGQNSYAGLGAMRAIQLLKGIVIADAMDDIKNTLNVIAADKKQAMEIFERQWGLILKSFSEGGKFLYKDLKKAADTLSKIPVQRDLKDTKKVLMVGEIYVRRDEFASQKIIDMLAKKDIIVHRSPILEWIHYVDYCTENLSRFSMSFKEKLEFFVRKRLQNRYEKKIKKILSASGLYDYAITDMDDVMSHAEIFIDKRLPGEAILCVGSFFHEIISHAQGIISIGPFACMPSRVTESILSPESKVSDNSRLKRLSNYDVLKDFDTLPFLSIECDGNPFPQIIESQIEAFSLQVERVFDKINEKKIFSSSAGSKDKIPQH